MARFVLVHGAWHGAWCWDKVVPLLEAAGHEVVAIDLPGHETPAGPGPETSLVDYAGAVAQAVEAGGEPAIVVGHSMGGGVITQAAALTDYIACLVYVAAFVPAHGQSINELAAKGGSDLSGSMQPIDDGTRLVIKPGTSAEPFYADCSEADQQAAETRLVPQAANPFADPLEDPDGKATRLRRVGIVCTEDRAIYPDLLQNMCDWAGITEVYEMDASHSPFLSQPERLVEILDEVARV